MAAKKKYKTIADLNMTQIKSLINRYEKQLIELAMNNEKMPKVVRVQKIRLVAKNLEALYSYVTLNSEAVSR